MNHSVLSISHATAGKKGVFERVPRVKFNEIAVWSVDIVADGFAQSAESRNTVLIGE